MAKRLAAGPHGRTLGAISVELFDSGDSGAVTAPGEFRLFRRGLNETDKGDFLLDDLALVAILSHFEKKNVDLSLDYNHQAMACPPVEAPAAGWYQLEARPDGLYAVNVRWTERAKAAIEAREFRYTSPAFDCDPETGRILRILNTALTNIPASHDIDALVAASVTAKEKDMNLEEELKKANARIVELEGKLTASEVARGRESNVLLGVVGLPTTAGVADLQGKVTSLVGFRKEVLTLSGADTEASAIGALTVMKEQATETLSLRAQVEAAEGAALKAEFTSYLDGISVKNDDSGKWLPPAKREKAEAMALSMSGGKKLTKAGVEEAKKFIPALMVTESGAETPVEGDEKILGAQAREVLSVMNIDRAKFAEWKHKRLAAGQR